MTILAKSRIPISAQQNMRTSTRGAEPKTLETRTEHYAKQQREESLARKPLTDRQWEVFSYMGYPYSNEDIANALHMSRKTLETHYDTLKIKTGTSNINDLRVLALKSRLDEIYSLLDKHPEKAEILNSEIPQLSMRDIEKLSGRPKEIFYLIGQGKSVREIGHSLFISPKTVETHVVNIRNALNVESGLELRYMAATYLYQLGRNSETKNN